jgi:putative membrane protein
MNTAKQSSNKFIPSERNAMHVVNALSFAIPVVVAILLGIPYKLDFGEWTKVLPRVIAGINILASFVLVIGWNAIRSKKIQLHRIAMLTAFLLGAAFLVCYVTYHLTNPSTRFGGEGAIRYVYYFILLSHIAMSLVVLPLVLRALLFALIGRFDLHRKIAVFALPIWLYVSITGVLAYWLISPYYQH